MHTFENLNIELTRTPTDADANAWVTTSLQGHSPGELKMVLNGDLRLFYLALNVL